MEDIIMNELEDKAIDIAGDVVDNLEPATPSGKGGLVFWGLLAAGGLAVTAVTLVRKNKDQLAEKKAERAAKKAQKKLDKAIKEIEAHGYAVYAVDPVVENEDEETELD